MIQNFKARPNFVVSKVLAIQFEDNADTISEISSFIGKDISINYEDAVNPLLSISTPSGISILSIGDYVVKTEDGNIWGCSKESFEKDYELDN